jgi:hypothetical protein
MLSFLNIPLLGVRSLLRQVVELRFTTWLRIAERLLCAPSLFRGYFVIQGILSHITSSPFIFFAQKIISQKVYILKL